MVQPAEEKSWKSCQKKTIISLFLFWLHDYSHVLGLYMKIN